MNMKEFNIKISNWLNHKKIAAISIILFICSMVPILYLARFDYATGDDYEYGAATHATWLATNSLLEVFRTSCDVVVQYYEEWQGTWFSIFLFTLQPEVFSPTAYWIVPIIMLILLVGSFTLLLYYITKKMLKFSTSSIIILDIIGAFMLIQYIPKTESGIYWYNGAAHYIVPFSISLLSFYFILRYLYENKIRFLVYLMFTMTLVGGANYLVAVLVPMITFLVIVVNFRSNKRITWLIIPLFMELIGLLISMVAPGNNVRGGEDFGFSIGRVITTFIQSVENGIQNIGVYFIERRIIFVLLILFALFVWEAFNQADLKMKFRHPFWFVLISFGVYCAMYAPGIYAGTVLSGGVPTTIYLVYILTSLVDIIYLFGWLSQKIKEKKYQNGMSNTYLLFKIPIILFCLVLLFINKGNLKDSTTYKCPDYLISGQARDYKYQMQERQNIVFNDTSGDVVIPQINNEQGPLRHMAILDDPTAWTNTIMADFYGKETIVTLPREEYNKKYGQ